MGPSGRAQKAWLSAVVDRILVSDEKIRIVGRKSNLEGPLRANDPVRPRFVVLRRNGAPLRIKLRTPM